MKTILLVTLQSDNIGNRLQNFALQETIKSMSYEVCTPYTNVVEWNSLKKRIKNRIKVILSVIGLKKYDYIRMRQKRIKKYMLYNQQYIDNMIKIEYKKAFKRKWEDRKSVV